MQPDKNAWDTDKARTAFDLVAAAAAALADGSARRAALATIGAAYRAARRLWRKGVSAAPAPGSIGTSSGSAIRLLSLDELRVRETRRAFAELAQRRVGHDARVKAEARREAEREIAAAAEEEEAERADDAAWALGREGRAGEWGTFREAKRRRTGDEVAADGERRLNDVSRYGAGKFAAVLAPGACGGVSGGAAGRVDSRFVAAADGDADGGEGAAAPSSAAAAVAAAASARTHKQMQQQQQQQQGDEDYRRKWR